MPRCKANNRLDPCVTTRCFGGGVNVAAMIAARPTVRARPGRTRLAWPRRLFVAPPILWTWPALEVEILPVRIRNHFAAVDPSREPSDWDVAQPGDPTMSHAGTSPRLSTSDLLAEEVSSWKRGRANTLSARSHGGTPAAPGTSAPRGCGVGCAWTRSVRTCGTAVGTSMGRPSGTWDPVPGAALRPVAPCRRVRFPDGDVE